MAKYLIPFAIAVLLLTACGLAADGATLSPARTPRPTRPPTPTYTPKPTPTRTPRPTFALLPASGASASGLLANTTSEARNLVWVYLSRCTSFDPKDLDAYQVGDLWYVKANDGARQQYGIWRLDAATGDLSPHDPLAVQWLAFLDNACNASQRAQLVIPTVTPTPTRPPPTPTAVLRNTADGLNALWAYLVKCFPSLSTTDLESTFDAASGAYVVKDKGTTVYGVWKVDRSTGAVSPDNDRARSRDLTVRRGGC